MIVSGTHEKYSIPLILEALKEISNTDEEYKRLKKDFFKSCIVDSLIEHYDRNPTNVAVIRGKNGVKFAPMFDNGTSLGVSIPLDIVNSNIENDEWLKEVRDRNKSKIGVESEKYSHYDKILEYILSNYYGEVKDLIDVINSELTPQNIHKILEDKKYSELDEDYKKLIIKKLSINRENLLELSNKYKSKYEIEELMQKNNLTKLLENMSESSTLQKYIPEIQFYSNTNEKSFKENMFRCINNINNLDELVKNNDIPLNLSDKEKKMVQWAILFNELGKQRIKQENLSNTELGFENQENYNKYTMDIANKKMDELNFYSSEKETIMKLIENYNRDLSSDLEIKDFIENIGEKNLKLYFAMKLADNNFSNLEVTQKNISKLKELNERIKIIQQTDNIELITKLPFSRKKLGKLGLSDSQCEMMQQKLAIYIRENPEIYAYYKARGHLEKYESELTQYAIEETKKIKHREKAEKLEQSIKRSKELSKKIAEMEKTKTSSREI